MNMRVGTCFVARICDGLYAVYQVQSIQLDGNRVVCIMVKSGNKNKCEDYVRSQR